MEDENRLIQERKRKLSEIHTLNVNPYPYSFKKTHTSTQLQEKYSGLKAEETTKDKEPKSILFSPLGIAALVSEST